MSVASSRSTQFKKSVIFLFYRSKRLNVIDLGAVVQNIVT